MIQIHIFAKININFMNEVQSTELAYDRIKTKCASLGVSISEVCRMAGVDRSILERWKTQNPKSINTLNAINAAIEEIEKGVQNG